MAGGPVVRVATLDDAATIDALMKASIAGLFPAFHDDAQVRSSIKYIGAVDRMLLEDGTYFVIEEDGDMVRAEVGAVATSCIRDPARAPMMPGSSIPRTSLLGSARCSCAPIAPAEASAR